MVQNPSKVAAIGSGLNSMFSQPTPLQPKAGPGGNRYEYNYQPAQYDSNGRIIKPASYGTPTVTHYAAAGGTIYGDDSGKGPYNDKGGIYGSDGPMYTNSSKYSGLMAQMHKMSPTLLSRYAKAAKDAAIQAAAQKELYAREVAPADYGDDVTAAAGGGLMSLNTYAAGGKLLKGPGDGMSDSIPAVIQGAKPQRAALAQGEFVIPAEFDEIKQFEQDYFLVSINEKWGLISSNGNVIVTPNYDYIKLIDEDLMVMSNLSEVHYYFIKTQQIVVPQVKRP
jgi:hypothetical protein